MKGISLNELESISGGASAINTVGCVLGGVLLLGGIVAIASISGPIGTAAAVGFAIEHVVGVTSTGVACASLIAGK